MTMPEDVIAYYERKTESVLQKYGPGPRVHFHGGPIEPDVVPASTVEGLRQQLVQAQENLLHEAAHFWDAERYLSGTVLDVGCGLGGGSIFWAQEYGARVFALTNVPSHLELIAQFAAQAGVGDRVVPLLGDACAIPGEQTFDAAVALDSAIYLDREAWFRHLSVRLRPGSRVFILDSLAEREEVCEPYDRYWMTRIGTVDGYVRASAAAGFTLDRRLDLTARTARFWELSVLYTRRLLESSKVMGEEAQRLRRSIRWHTWFLEQWKNRTIVYFLFSFVHSGHSEQGVD